MPARDRLQRRWPLMAVSGKSVWLRDLVKGENRLLPPDVGATPPVFALAISSDSKLLAYGDKKGNIVIRDMMAIRP